VIKKINRNSGFTLIQTVIVIVILGALAGMAIPRMITLTYKVKNQEALPVLISLLEAQFDYKRVNGAYTTTVGNLDITVPELKNFIGVDSYDGSETLDCGSGDQIKIVNVISLKGTYRLIILEDGNICCRLSSDDNIKPSICTRMGFN